jgi:hypothetical protein
MPLTPALPLRVDVDSRLSEDVLPVAPVSVDPTAPGQTAVTLDADGKPLILLIAPGVGAAEVTEGAGRSVRALPEGADAREIVALVDGDGRVNAFYATGSDLLHVVRDKKGRWRGPTKLPASTGLSVTEIPLTGTFAISGISPNGNLTIYTENAGNWSATSVDVGGKLLGGEARLAYTSPDAWLLFAASGGALLIWSGTEGRVAAAPEVVRAAAPVARVVATYPHADSAMVVFTDTQNTLYSSVGFTDTPARIPLGEVVAGSAVVDGTGMVHCYGAAPDGRLWHLRQTAWAEDDSPVWAQIFPLDRDVAQVRTPVTGFGTLVVTQADGSVDLLSRDHAGWTREPVRSEAPATPMRVSRYRTRVTVSDANGLPCPEVTVELTPARLVGLESGGRMMIAEPGQVTPLTTDGTGRVEFGQHAAGLDSVTFTARVEGATEPVTIIPHSYVYDALAGRAPVFNGTTTIPPMSAETLLTVQVDGKPLITDRDLARVAANAVVALVKTHEGTQSGGGFEVDLKNPDAPRFVAHATADAVTARLAELRGAPEAFSGGLAGWFEDVLRAIATGAGRLVSFIVNPSQQTASALVESAEGVVTLVEDLVLTGAAAVGSLVQGVFNAIGAAWDQFKDFIQDRLHWKSIWRTMDAFYERITTGLTDTTDLLHGRTAEVTTTHFFADLKAKANAGLDAAAAALGDATIGDLMGGDLRRLPLPGSGRPPGLGTALPGSPAQYDVVLSKLLTNLPDKPVPIPKLPDGFAGRLVKAVDDTGIMRDGDRTVRDLMTACTALFRDTSRPGDVRVADLLALFRDLIDLVADVIDILAVALLEFAAAVVQAVVDVLTTPISDVPVLPWFWNNVVRPSGNEDPMTLGRLLCLTLATPVTLACLADKGRGPFDPVTRASAVPGLSDSQRAEALYWTSLVLIGVDICADAINTRDALADVTSVASVVFNGLDFVANVLAVLFADIPEGFITKWPTMSTGARMTNVTTLLYLVPTVVDALFTLLDVGELIGVPAPELKFTSFTINTAVDCVLGVGLAVAGTVGAGYQLHDHEAGVTELDVYEAIVGPLPWVGQPCLMPEVVTSTEGLTAVIQMGILDPLGDYDMDGPGGS